MKIIISVILIIFAVFSLAGAEDKYKLDDIVIRPVNYSFESLSGSQIRKENVNSPVEVLDRVAGVDLRNRGPFGIQSDLSLNGSTYEQVGILIDGVNVNDPQTGHHNLDIPLTQYDLEKIEIDKTGVGSLYGNGAFAGSVNFIVKKPVKKSLNIDTLFGEHALFGQSFSLSLPQESFSTRVSFDHKIAKAARPNTDFEYKTASFYIDKDLAQTNINALFGYQKKDFGADSFYSNLFPEEEEHTETVFTKLGHTSDFSLGKLKDNLFFRKHRDKFILRRNNPTSVNYHTTYLSGIDSELEIPARLADFVFGVNIAEDQINSTNLGKHSRFHQAGSFGIVPKLGDKFTADLRFRADNYQQWGDEETYSAGLGYDLIKERLKVNGSFGHSFRIPTFTELYYSDAANKGNPELKPEKSDNFRIGFDYAQNILELGLDGFLRKGHNLIDWTRATTADPWQATNLGKVDFWGVEFKSKLKTNLKFKYASFDKAAFSYNYMLADKNTGGFLSKYALDILKHRYLLEIFSGFLGLEANFQLSYNQRYYGETYFVGNLYLGKKIHYRDYIFEPFVKIDNFSNAKYTEISGVLQPGRWIQSGLKFEW
ncbi:MAG: TonB-dependent receptor [Candidatus Omnitrophica bacterium]|nr:TonB-dependent receptor [Candidatus Omnitrophota bacterium]